MKVSVRVDDGTEVYSYDTNKDALCLHPSQTEAQEVVASLYEAIRFLFVIPTNGNDKPSDVGIGH